MEISHYIFLVAESDPSLRATICQLLLEWGAKQALGAADGTEAWSILKKQGADFVVAAWDMPEMGGLALLKVVRTDPELAEVPFILLAEALTRSQVIEAGEAGVSDILLLPLNPRRLKDKVLGVLESESEPQTLEARRLYNEGLKLMRAQRWEEALKAFQQILKVYESAEVYYNMGYIKTAQGEYEEAIHYFRKATRINNTFAKAYEKMGEVYVKLGRKRLAQACFERAAEIYLERQSDADAEKLLLEVLKLNPRTINVYNTLGILYRRQGRYELALKQYKKALRVNPRDENIYYNLGRLYFEINRPDKAMEALTRALKLNPEFAEAQVLMRTVKISSQGLPAAGSGDNTTPKPRTTREEP